MQAPHRLSLLLLLAIAAGCFPHQPGPRLAHFPAQAPAIGEPAPEFTLVDLDGDTVELADLVGDKPVVLQLGSHSCPVYRYRRFSMRELWDELRGRVHFVMVYTLEAHPVGSKSPYAEGEWLTMWNRVTGVRVEQHKTAEDRHQQAAASHQRLELEPRMVVDGLDNAVWEAYGSASSPAFVIDLEGKIAARQVWVDPEPLREVLLRLLDESDD